ncbi:uncharacterized protein LOC111618899 [Centruroides sculpturatus]|uniref:uncharacterized protein LOC111618899 n=1 Tax=Centruroides sculpturatus TaxID=218467 RepID=UPI000C6E354B|nr:uncharacterized protein LOC111618899 [Centruroides sculpturatus]
MMYRGKTLLKSRPDKLLVNCIFGLRLVKLDVPGAVFRGDSVWLNCSFDLESDELYSVKWYKNNVEFYRYLPSDQPPAQKYEQVGVYLDLAKSYQGHLYLYRTDLYTEGTYRCEVSAESPSFQTIREENDIRIYGNNYFQASPRYVVNYPQLYHHPQLQLSRLGLKFVANKSYFPDGLLKFLCIANYTIISSITSDEYYATNSSKPLGPHLALSSFRSSPIISGARRRYEVGDLVFVNCTAPKSLSHTQLKWFINDKEAREENVFVYPDHVYPDGQRADNVGLRFIVQPHHFQRDIIRLKCSAVLTSIISKRSEEKIIGGGQPSSGLRVSEHARTGWYYFSIFSKLVTLISDLLLKK